MFKKNKRFIPDESKLAKNNGNNRSGLSIDNKNNHIQNFGSFVPSSL